MTVPTLDLYRGRKPILIPAYTLAEAAGYLHVPAATVRSWVLGRTYPTAEGARQFRPVIRIAGRSNALLSFQNLIELHVLSALRRRHEVRLPEVRRAVVFLEKRYDTEHPLADLDLYTDGADVLVREYERLVSASRGGQLALKDVVEAYLKRVERDELGVARLYPFTSSLMEASPRAVVIDSRVQFGRPCLAGTGIPTTMIRERFVAGDTIMELARDYGRTEREIEEALRFENAAA